MYHPPQRIKHALPEARWPTEVEAAASRWFSSIQIGPVGLEQRTWVPAMVPWRATEDGFVTDEALDWYERFAQGRPGAIVVEATGIRDIPSGPLLRIGHDRFIPGLAKLADTVRRTSGDHTRLFIQIIDFLAIKRRPEKGKYFLRFFRPGQIDDETRRRFAASPDEELCKILTTREWEDYQVGYRERVTDTDLPHIRELPEVLPDIFSAAAFRAKKAGFDGVELHYAHAYTMASFLSAQNDRSDGYGGPCENRVRLPLSVYHAVRDRVGKNFVVGCRYLSEDCIPGGNTVDDAAYFGLEFARAGMDYLSLSRGGKFEDAKQPQVGWAAYPYTGPSGYECIPTVISDKQGPFGRNIPATARIRHAIRHAGFATPIVVTGGISTFDQAESILARGEADIVGAARQSLADPDWFLKARLGHGHEIRRCVFTNYCEGLDQKHKQVTCKLWDRVGLQEPKITFAKEGNRRLIPPAWRRE